MSQGDEQSKRTSKESSSFIEHSAGPTKHAPPPVPPKGPKGGGVGEAKRSR